MIEVDWLSGKDPRKMLDYLLNGDRDKPDLFRPAVTMDRKLRLFVAAVERLWWEDYTPSRLSSEYRASLDLLDALADGRVGPYSPEVDRIALGRTIVVKDAAADARMCLRIHNITADQPVWADLLRCVFGNPLRPVRAVKDNEVWTFRSGDRDLVASLPVTSWLTWNEGTVARLAQAIYVERAWDRLPFLADALEEAGCTDQAILDHLRPRTCPECKGRGRWGPGGGMRCLGCYWTGRIGHTGLHTRGCWVLDLLLGKS